MIDPQAAQLEKFPRRTQRRQQTRARIMRSAMKLFRQMGYGAATMNAIAEAADVHVTTLFTHFKNKRDLAVSLNDSAIARLEQMVAESRGKLTLFEFFRTVVLGAVRTIEGESDPTLTVWHELRRDPELTFAWVRYEQRQVALIADYIAKEYGLDQETDYRPELAASLMMSSTWISHRHWSEASLERDLEAETLKAIGLAERMVIAILPPRLG